MPFNLQSLLVSCAFNSLERSGAPLIELWGMTEISGLGTTHTLHAPPEPGPIGELMVRGPIVMLGYHNNPEASAETIEPDGWLHTGDIATMKDTGRVFVVDRRKDMIITGGYNVYPAEIERVLADHPAVAMVAVGPVPEDARGNSPAPTSCSRTVPRPPRAS